MGVLPFTTAPSPSQGRWLRTEGEASLGTLSSLCGHGEEGTAHGERVQGHVVVGNRARLRTVQEVSQPRSARAAPPPARLCSLRGL